MAVDVDSLGEVTDVGESEGGSDAETNAKANRALPRWMFLRPIVTIGVVVTVGAMILVGWLGSRAYHAHQAEREIQLFVQVARQGALNLTTIKFTDVDADVKKILDSSTGTFRDEFESRSMPFADIVRQSKAETVGTVSEAAVELLKGDGADVLVAVAVRTSNAGVAEPTPRQWRMRISVKKIDGDVKISNVGFVS